MSHAIARLREAGYTHSQYRCKILRFLVSPHLLIVMDDFANSMGNLFTLMGYGTIAALCIAGIFIYIVHHTGE